WAGAATGAARAGCRRRTTGAADASTPASPRPRPSCSCARATPPTPARTARTCCRPGTPRRGRRPCPSTQRCAGRGCRSWPPPVAGCSTPSGRCTSARPTCGAAPWACSRSRAASPARTAAGSTSRRCR
ncbi:MAG: UPF0225 protein YchJ, partial [uncultured Frankineae bacterium]